MLKKALSHNLKPIVVLNKVDRESARLGEVENEIFDLFCSLDATEDQLDYPLIYASARNGWAISDMAKERNSVSDLLEAIIGYVPQPKVDLNNDFKMLITQTESNKYFGRMLIGRLHSGKLSIGDKVQAID